MLKKCAPSVAAILVAVMLHTATAADYPSKNFEVIAGAGPGSGWDTTIRMVVKELKEQNIVTTAMPVSNRPGGGGGIALTYLQRKKGDPYTLTIFSPPLLLINLTGQSKLGYRDATPIAMMIQDYGAFGVPKNSKYTTINEVFDAVKKDPKSVKIGGASSLGSMDHLQFLIAAKAAGVTDLKAIQYIAFQGGESLSALMGSHIDLLTTGMAELVGAKESGDIRVLALTAPERVTSGALADVPTLRECGIDAEYINWRGIFGPPEMLETARNWMEEALRKVAESPSWKEKCARNGWTESYMGHEDFAAFLEEANEESKAVLAEINMLVTP